MSRRTLQLFFAATCGVLFAVSGSFACEIVKMTPRGKAAIEIPSNLAVFSGTVIGVSQVPATSWTDSETWVVDARVNKAISRVESGTRVQVAEFEYDLACEMLPVARDALVAKYPAGQQVEFIAAVPGPRGDGGSAALAVDTWGIIGTTNADELLPRPGRSAAWYDEDDYPMGDFAFYSILHELEMNPGPRAVTKLLEHAQRRFCHRDLPHKPYRLLLRKFLKSRDQRRDLMRQCEANI